MNDNPMTAFLLGCLLVFFAAAFTWLSWSYRADAAKQAAAVEAMRAVPEVALAEVPAYAGREVAVRGWAAGTWPSQVEDIALPGPVLFCESHAHGEHCERSDEESCPTKWYRSDGRTPPVVVLLSEPPTTVRAEAPATSVRVDLSQANLHLSRLAEGKKWYLTCLRADRELTVFGRAGARGLGPGARFVAGALPPDELIAAEVERGPVTAGRHSLHFALAAAGSLLLGVGLVVWAVRQG